MSAPELAEVLRATLRNAVRAPYYRRVFKHAWTRVRSIDDLARLPLLDKPTAIRHQRELLTQKPPGALGVVSTGTTRADLDLPPLFAVRDPPPQGPPSPDVPWAGWRLEVVNMVHGLPPYTVGERELRVAWSHDRNALYALEAALGTARPDGGRVTAMLINTGALKCFTSWMLERGRDFSAFRVRLIGTNGFRLSPFWRRLVEEKFQAAAFDNYSLSEFDTPATECHHCSWLHFGSPPLVAEVLDLATGRRLERGAGRLVLTSLYPDVTTMPLIRYDTGDVVERGGVCAKAQARKLRFLGRVRRGLLVKDAAGHGEFLLAPVHVQDVLEEHSDTERTPHPLFTLGHLRTAAVGLPRWVVEQKGRPGRQTVRLRFEVRFEPHVFVDRARELEEQVRRALLSAEPALRRGVKAKRWRFVVEATAPRSLTPPPDKYA